MPLDVAHAAHLDFARGKVGQRYPLRTDQERAAFAQECAEHTVPLTLTNTADCGDERVTIALGDGTTDEAILAARVAPQLFGGLYLATTKALVQANAAVIKDAKSIWGAFMIIEGVLTRLGYQDAAHENCGAEAMVESSVANEVSLEGVMGTAGLIAGNDPSNRYLLTSNAARKRQLLNNGFYGDWSSAKRKEHILAEAPSNYSYLKEDPNDKETFGHNGSGLYAITQRGMGYRKTGRAFAITQPTMVEMSHLLGETDEERRRILLGFADDTAHVGAGLVAKDFPVFVQAS